MFQQLPIRDCLSLVKRPRNLREGFTLLELLVVVGILAALVALALPYYQDYVNQAKLTAAAADLTTFKKALMQNDQLEPTVFSGPSLLPLIGKYLSDYRRFAGQINPVDPWGNDYTVRTDDGAIICGGANRFIDTVSPNTVASYDDILEIWKPPFTLSSCRAINTTQVEVNFSRKVVDSSVTSGAIVSITNPGSASTVKFKISDTTYRFTVAPALTTGVNHLLTTLTTFNAQDGKVGLHAIKADGSFGEVASFTY